MPHPRRLMYLGHYARHMNWSLLKRFMRHTRDQHGIGWLRQTGRVLADSLRYNISPLEWYQFGFVSLAPEQKATWAGTGTLYEFQLRANPPAERGLLADKIRFYRAYRAFFRHSLWAIEELAADPALIGSILAGNERVVFKSADGNCGKAVQIKATSSLSASSLIEWMRSQGFDLVESFIDQHPALNALSPAAVNTVRIFTLIDRNDQYHVLGCRLRISVNSPVDNLAAGNLAAPIDESSGIVSGPGVYSDITRSPEAVHPVTGTDIVGFQLPFWPETLEMVRQASLLHPQNRSIGWDIAITANGPGLIEGNHDWCKLVWQLPVGVGLKGTLGAE